MKNDVIEIPKKIKSNNILMRSHWNVKRIDKKEYALLIRNQMRLKKVKKCEQKKYTLLIISMRKRLLDLDNLIGGCKQLIDACVEEQLIFDDSPEYVDLKFKQITNKQEITMIIRKDDDENCE